MTRVYKTCVVCGRRMAWRRRWRNNWKNVRYCSSACRRRGLTETDREMETVIIALLKKQRTEAGIGIQDVVDRMGTTGAGSGSTPLLQAARSAARRLYNQRVVDVFQRGRPVDPSTAKGPFCIRLRPRG